MIIEVIASFFAAYSFGILFNIKDKYLTIAGFGGAIGWFIYKLCLVFGISDAVSLFISALCFSTYSEISARIYKTPSTLLSVCSLIPLVPGYGIYNTMYEFIKGNYITGMDYAISTISSACSLALGFIFISTFFRSFRFKKLYSKHNKHLHNQKRSTTS